MDYEIQNLTRRLVSVRCNSGKTCHLPPGHKHKVPEQEISGNPAVKKLMARNLIKIPDFPKSSGSKSAAKSTGKERAKPAKAASAKKSSVKKSPARKPSRSKK